MGISDEFSFVARGPDTEASRNVLVDQQQQGFPLVALADIGSNTILIRGLTKSETEACEEWEIYTKYPSLYRTSTLIKHEVCHLAYTICQWLQFKCKLLLRLGLKQSFIKHSVGLEAHIYRITKQPYLEVIQQYHKDYYTRAFNKYWQLENQDAP
jgi:hypothetical protein